MVFFVKRIESCLVPEIFNITPPPSRFILGTEKLVYVRIQTIVKYVANHFEMKCHDAKKRSKIVPEK